MHDLHFGRAFRLLGVQGMSELDTKAFKKALKYCFTDI